MKNPTLCYPYPTTSNKMRPLFTYKQTLKLVKILSNLKSKKYLVKFNVHKHFSINICTQTLMMNLSLKTANQCSLHNPLSSKTSYQFSKIRNNSIKMTNARSLSKNNLKFILILKFYLPESTPNPITQITSFVLNLLSLFSFSQFKKKISLKRIHKFHLKIKASSKTMKLQKFNKFIK